MPDLTELSPNPNLKQDPTWRRTTWNSLDYMVCTISEPQKLPVFKPGQWTVNAHRQIALYGHDAKNTKQLTLHFQVIAQHDTLDRPWFGEVRFQVDKNEWGVHNAPGQGNNVDPGAAGDLDLEPGQPEPELCFSRSQARDPANALLDIGVTHALLPDHMLTEGARSFEVTVKLAVGKEKARCSEVYAEDRARPLLPLGRLANLLDTKFLWENGQAFNYTTKAPGRP